METAVMKIDHTELSHSMAHHLLAVAELISDHGYARVTDIAARLTLTRGSVSVAMQSLRGAGYVEQDANRFFRLTARGARAVASIRARHRVVEQFFTEVLGLPGGQAHRESCRLEYLLEAETTRRLMAMVECWRQLKREHAVELDVADGCLACSGGNGQPCPCCGLECLTGTCELRKDSSGDSSDSGV